MLADNNAAPKLKPLWRQALGKPDDWHLGRPRRLLGLSLRSLKPTLGWSGLLALVASVVAIWPAFAGATGDGGNVAFGLYIGAVSIVLMSWSFLLAVRIRALEPFFGGLDRMYRVHRWAGTFAVLAMFLHTSIEPEIEGGIRGAGRSLADQAEDLAGVGEYLLYGLVAISLLRWFPYRYWRWTHKMLGVPFIFACFHFFTAEKPYANGSGWGLWFGAVMVIGIVAYLWRVVVRDAITKGRRYRIVEGEVSGSTLDLRLEPVGRPLTHDAGQFAMLKVQRRDLLEPHPFTIASSPDDDHLRFFVRDLGDWTARLHQADLKGLEVLVEGPYGRFDPIGSEQTRTVWVAGGVGITPFLSAIASLPANADEDQRPVLFYCLRSRSDAMALDVLNEAVAEGRLHLELCPSDEGRRFGPALLAEHAGPDGLAGAHVAICGPAGLVHAASEAARSMGAEKIETEDFDIRQGFGPDLSRQVESTLVSARRRTGLTSALNAEEHR